MRDFIKRVLAYIATHFITIGVMGFIGIYAIMCWVKRLSLGWEYGEYGRVLFEVGLIAMFFGIVWLCEKLSSKKK